MKIFERIEQRVALPGDSETRRTQKVLATALMFAGSFFSYLNVVTYFARGMTTAGYILLFWVFFLLTSGLLMLALPRYILLTGSLALTVSIFVSLASHVYAGGFTSGMEAAPWMLIGPVFAVFLVGPRFSIFILFVYVVSVAAAAYLEPFAQSVAPELPLDTRMQIAAGNLIILGIVVIGAGLFLLRQLEHYRRRAEDLLLNILPGSIAEQLKESPGTIADGYGEVTVLFADIVDFTQMSSGADPVEVVGLLNDIFSEFDDLAEKYGLEKIKTIGDAYMVAAGLPEPRPDHAQAIAAFAVDMLEAIEGLEGLHGEPIRLRVGINTGPVVAGVIGRQKFIYDLWGDAVNVASRMESNGLANQIQVTEAVKEKLDGQYTFVEREPIYIKGKGMMVTYLLE